MSEPSFTGFYARPKTSTDKLKSDRWHAVFVRPRQPDPIFVEIGWTDHGEEIPLVIDDYYFSLEPIDLYVNPQLATAEMDMAALPPETRECIQDILEARPRLTMEVIRNGSLVNRFMEVAFKDRAFYLPVEAIINPKTGNNLTLESKERVLEAAKAASLVGAPIWIYDARALEGLMKDQFRDLGHCLLRVSHIDYYAPSFVFFSSGRQFKHTRYRYTQVPEDMEIKSGMWVMPFSSNIPEIVHSIGSDYIVTRTGTHNLRNRLETELRLLTKEEQDDVNERMKPKPMALAKAIEQLGPTLHDMIMRFPTHIFTRGTVFQRIQDQLPKECDTGEKIMEYIIANPGKLQDPNEYWPELPLERSNENWFKWIAIVNAMAKPLPAKADEPADDELIKLSVRFLRKRIEVKRDMETETWDGMIELPYGIFKLGQPAVEEYINDIDASLEPDLILTRSNTRHLDSDLEPDSDSVEITRLDRVPDQVQPSVPERTTEMASILPFPEGDGVMMPTLAELLTQDNPTVIDPPLGMMPLVPTLTDADLATLRDLELDDEGDEGDDA